MAPFVKHLVSEPACWDAPASSSSLSSASSRSRRARLRLHRRRLLPRQGPRPPPPCRSPPRPPPHRCGQPSLPPPPTSSRSARFHLLPPCRSSLRTSPSAPRLPIPLSRRPPGLAGVHGGEAPRLLIPSTTAVRVLRPPARTTRNGRVAAAAGGAARDGGGGGDHWLAAVARTSEFEVECSPVSMVEK